uniref:Claudin a n=1 Tax=Seriola dumerili TaxID=41447 RepID=A0A3B4T6A2_SERDU
MVSASCQMLGTALCIIGWIGVIVACALPQWKVTAFIGQSIVTAQTTWEGIWMNCVIQSTGQMQCKVYDSMLALSRDLQAARALIIISVLIGIVGILLSMAGGKCTNSNTTIRDFYNPLVPQAQKRELGVSLFIGWGASALLIMGGAILCANCPPKDNYSAKYSAARSSAPKDYV